MPYQPGHGLTYAIKVVSMASNGDLICRCKFCVYEGHDEVEVGVAGRKHKQCSNIQYFSKPFLLGKYRNHHVRQHGASWTLYQSLLVTEKKAYFDGKIKHTNTLHTHMDLATDTPDLSSIEASSKRSSTTCSFETTSSSTNVATTTVMTTCTRPM
ncbi:unnamed protein product [Sphagnum jensenii]|uniref:Uncharacterized protein n=1 Tax=Sphagnum jensenii TaxID=128206 RepID=A0ABP1BGU2_9BRYO